MNKDIKDVHLKYLPILYQIVIVAGLCGIFYLIYYHIFPAVRQVVKFLLPIFAPFIIGWVISALIEPLVNYTEKIFKLKRGWAVFICLTAIFALLVTVLAVGISKLTAELIGFSKIFPKYTNDITSYFTGLLYNIKDLYRVINVSPQLIEGLSGNISSLLGSLTNILTDTANALLVFLTNFVPNFLLILIISILASFFISRDKEVIEYLAAKILPASIFEMYVAISEDMVKAIIGYLRAILILMSITALQTIIGLYILGVEYALTMALIVGVMDILPILGPGTVFVPWIIYEIIKGELFMALGLGIIYVFIIVVRQLLEPKIVAENIGLHPFATLIAIYVGLKLFGFIGVILGPIFLVVAKAVVRGSILSKWF
ncbi:MAG: sporulation integral membrane protein YtvI [Clostridia bacterium]|nr:sporulation integral membrane protein YtvI [Clostridia bacterium]